MRRNSGTQDLDSVRPSKRVMQVIILFNARVVWWRSPTPPAKAIQIFIAFENKAGSP